MFERWSFGSIASVALALALAAPGSVLEAFVVGDRRGHEPRVVEALAERLPQITDGAPRRRACPGP